MTIQKTTKRAAAPEPQVHFIQKVIGSDTYLVMADSATHLEDEFANMYYTASATGKIVILPPYEPKVLAQLVSKNNILNQCIEAMEVNIDGTGHEFVPAIKDKEMDAGELARMTDFFNEPYPGDSFISQRRRLRRDLESVGYAALEPLRSLDGTVIAMRNLDSYNLRFIKLDEAVMVEKIIMRGGKEIKLKVMERERRFLQRLGNQYYYYREFGSTRHCNKNTGLWESETNPVAPEDRATELLLFEVNPDISSPYGVPRWINQLPSVVGSRKAEEQNLEFFDAGGLPPAIIFVQGGTLAKDAADQLRNYLSGKNKNKNRAVVVEAQSSSGSLESAGSVQVKVERFGAERANDAMYANYDKAAEEHVRVGFRMPPLFLGKAADYNYATAVVAYMVAEEQVFQPERQDFDEIINKTICKALGVTTVRLQSLPITLKNIDAQLKALALIQQMVDPEEFVNEVNKMTGTSLTYAKQEALPIPGAGQQFHPQTGEIVASAKVQMPQEKAKPGIDPNSITKSAAELIQLALKFSCLNGLVTPDGLITKEDRLDIEMAVHALKGEDLKQFNTLIASYAFKDASIDLVTLVDCGHAH
jgi:PBSX family phage portal protein